MNAGDKTDDTQPRIVRPGSGRPNERTALLIWSGTADPREGPQPPTLWELRGALEIGRDPKLLPNETVARLPGVAVSRHHARIVRARSGGYLLQDLGSLNGTFVDGARVRGERTLGSGSVISVGNHVLVFRIADGDEVEALREQLEAPFGPTLTLSPTLAIQRRELRRLARSSLDLLLAGETGVGKEIYAEALHLASGRKGPFEAINCAALPDTLLESELYGYARGAHSTATHEKRGLIERAAGGTLFLDEIGEMPAATQAKLLRFLQTRTFTPLGATQPLHLDVRVLAATNRPLGTDTPLRADLVARFGSNPIWIQPLRERIEDVGPLAAHLMGDARRLLSPEAYYSLFLYAWPGNVRELETVMTMASVLAGDAVIDLSKLPVLFRRALDTRRHDDAPAWPNRPPRPTPTPAELTRLLEQHAGDVATVARKLGRQRTLVWRWLRENEIRAHDFRN
jgi:transcriptional regulator with PAS, ATPase and Fis domain